MPSLVDLTGQRFGRLVVLGRAPNRGRRTAWRAQCDCGTETETCSRELIRGRTKSCGCLHKEISRARMLEVGPLGAAARRKPVPAYLGAHHRVRRQRGSAGLLPCQHCGGAAKDWAYDHSDPAPHHEVIRGVRLAYSLDLNRYIPLCRPCHSKFDESAESVVDGPA